MGKTVRIGLVAALIGLPEPAPGQDASRPEPSGDDRVEAVIERLRPDERLRVQVAEAGTLLEGRFGGAAEGQLDLFTGVEERRLPVGEIERLWTRGNSAGRGAWIGALGGLVLGAAYGAAISEVTCAESSCTTLGLMAAIGGMGAAGGAAVGALVGLAIPSWRLRFP